MIIGILVVVGLLAVFALMLVIVMHHVVTSRKPEDMKISYLKSVYETLEKCKLKTDNEGFAAKIDEIIDVLKYSDANSPPKVSVIEQRIYENVQELLELVEENKRKVEIDTQLENLLELVRERNIMIKNSK